MKYTETCPCGSRFEVEALGWGLRSLDISAPLGEWRTLHRRHIAGPGPTRDQLDHFRALRNGPTTPEAGPE